MAASNKSTIVRAIQTLVSALAKIQPRWAARVASWLFFRTGARQPVPPDQQAVLDRATRTARIHTPFGDASIWVWGAGPRVVLQHGWRGWAGQLSGFVQPLVDAGFEVVAVDAPGHGISPGNQSSFPAMSEALLAIAGERPVHAVVAHSLGCSGAVMAFDSGLPVSCFVGIGGAARPLAFFDGWVRTMVDEPTAELERQRLGAYFGRPWAEFETLTLAARRTEPMLWIHDTRDKEVAFAEGERVVEAWPGGEMMRTEGLGHRRILRSPEVIRAVVDFVLHHRSA